VPVVSEDPKLYYPYPAIYGTSEDSSWSDISTTTPYQERNIFKTHCPEGAYIEKAGRGVFIITYLPGLKSPIRTYKTPRNHSRRYFDNPNYQASLNKSYYHRVLNEAEQRAFEEEAPKVIQAYTKPKEEDLAPAEGNSIKISEIFRFNRTFHLRLEDNRPAPIKSIKVGKGKWISNLPNIIKYTKIRYQEWLYAGGEDSGEKFFIDLWDPKALKAFADPDKDTHPGAQLLRDWNKVKEKEKNKRPTPKRLRGRNNPLNWHLV
jgi:hypothetical protein